MKRFFTMCLISIGVFSIFEVESSYAQVTVRGGQDVSLAKEQIVNGNFYASSDVITLSGEVAGDASLLAYRAVTLNGVISRDALVVASEVNVFGAVGEDVRIVAGDVVIADRVEGDVLVIAGSLEILSTASVGGDLLFYGGTLTMAGAVEGTVLGRMQSVRIDGPVTGDVLVTADRVVLGDRAKVDGVVQYTSAVPLERAANATLGEVRRVEPTLGAPITVQTVLIPFLISLFSVLVWQLTHRRSLLAIMSACTDRPAQSTFIGLALLFFGPPTAVIVLATVIGALIGFWLLFGWLVLIVLAVVAIGPVIGAWCARVGGYGTAWNPLWHMVIGTALLHLLRFVPIVGVIVVSVVLLLTAGSILRLLFQQLFPFVPPDQVA